MEVLEVVRNVLAFLIPSSLAILGSVCLGLCLVLIAVDMPGGANWSKIGGWFALVGGFGTVGAASGWLGVQIMSTRADAQSFAENYGGQLIGGGVLIVVLLGAALWAYKHLKSKGIEAGGKGGAMKKVRSLLKAGVLALVGATLAVTIPQLYDGANWVLASVHGFVA